jgi:hypothetical protein
MKLPDNETRNSTAMNVGHQLKWTRIARGYAGLLLPEICPVTTIGQSRMYPRETKTPGHPAGWVKNASLTVRATDGIAQLLRLHIPKSD